MRSKSNIIDCDKIADIILDSLKKEVKLFKLKHNTSLEAVVILWGDQDYSEAIKTEYVKAANNIGIDVKFHIYGNDISEENIKLEIEKLNNNPEVHAIIVLMDGFSYTISKSIEVTKDVDGIHPLNLGMLYSGDLSVVPATARAVLKIIDYYKKELTGKKVVVVGRSPFVGRAISALLLAENYTVTTCHSRTENLSELTSRADIVVSAIGKYKFLTEEYFSKNQIVIDVGISVIIDDDKVSLKGDVDFEKVKNKVKYITPVPGIGIISIAYLLANTFNILKKIAK